MEKEKIVKPMTQAEALQMAIEAVTDERAKEVLKNLYRLKKPYVSPTEQKIRDSKDNAVLDVIALEIEATVGEIAKILNRTPQGVTASIKRLGDKVTFNFMRDGTKLWRLNLEDDDDIEVVG